MKENNQKTFCILYLISILGGCTKPLSPQNIEQESNSQLTSDNIETERVEADYENDNCNSSLIERYIKKLSTEDSIGEYYKYSDFENIEDLKTIIITAEYFYDVVVTTGEKLIVETVNIPKIDFDNLTFDDDSSENGDEVLTFSINDNNDLVIDIDELNEIEGGKRPIISIEVPKNFEDIRVYGGRIQCLFNITSNSINSRRAEFSWIQNCSSTDLSLRSQVNKSAVVVNSEFNNVTIDGTLSLNFFFSAICKNRFEYKGDGKLEINFKDVESIYNCATNISADSGTIEIHPSNEEIEDMIQYVNGTAIIENNSGKKPEVIISSTSFKPIELYFGYKELYPEFLDEYKDYKFIKDFNNLYSFEFENINELFKLVGIYEYNDGPHKSNF